MLYPNLEDVKKYLENYKTVPVFYELLMDSSTPVQLFNCLHELYEDCFILESVDNKDKWGRYSYVGIDPTVEYELKDHVMTVRQPGKAPVQKQLDDLHLTLHPKLLTLVAGLSIQSSMIKGGRDAH